MKYDLVYKRYGERSILVEWPSKIDEIMLHDILNFKNKVEKKYTEVIVEVIISYNSALICYNFIIKDLYSRFLELKSIYADQNVIVKSKNKLWKIPVCYSVALAPDLEFFAEAKSLSVDEIIRLHTTPLYTVYFIGFLPGFLYLGGLPEKLFLPRKQTPVLNVQKGSVAIGGNQTGVYPVNSPGGWHVIGKTPIDLFDINSPDLCFASSGDKIQFISIDENKYTDINLNLRKGIFELQYEEF